MEPLPVKQGLPAWAKVLIGIFVAGIIALVALGSLAVYYFGVFAESTTNPAKAAQASRSIADFKLPLPPHFKFSAGANILTLAWVSIVHEPDNQLFTFTKIPAGQRTADEMLAAQNPGSNNRIGSNFSLSSQGRIKVAGEDMPYLIADIKRGDTIAGQEFIGIVVPKGRHEAVLLTVLSSSKIDLDETKELLADIQGFGNAQTGSSSAKPDSSTNDAH